MSKMENKTKMKKSFILVFTIFLSILFSIYSLTILENKTISSNLNRLKYLHLQAQIHISYIKNIILKNRNIDIKTLTINDSRFSLNIIENNESNITAYFISIETIKDTPVRICERIYK